MSKSYGTLNYITISALKFIILKFCFVISLEIHSTQGPSFQNSGIKHKNTSPLADLRGGREGRTPPPKVGHPNSFNFMQFLGEFGKIAPLLEGSRPTWGKSWIRHCKPYAFGNKYPN